MERRRIIDQRIEKYFNKLKEVDPVAHHLYQVELVTRYRAKEKSKENMRDLLEEIIDTGNIKDEDLKNRILIKINTY
jgi:hypothetical protein